MSLNFGMQRPDMAYSRRTASVLSITGLFFFSLGFIVFQNTSILLFGFPANPFIVIGFLFLGTGLLQPLSEKMKGKKK